MRRIEQRTNDLGYRYNNKQDSDHDKRRSYLFSDTDKIMV
ncbi:hypothetical protein VAEKB19_1300001 [Vibrio aestuarianus]|nr:hypothetical protein VAEKB19_1300001 [Vibrio aestuarianus]